MKFAKRLLSAVVVVAIIGLPLVGVWKAQAIQDWWRLRDYTPPAEVASLAAADAMTPKATHIFYVNNPKLYSDVLSFRKNCSQTEQTIVLGCYHPVQSGIALYNVQDTRLEGVKQVTAAHEMLHAAYDRLSRSERTKVDAWLESYYKNDLHDQRILDTINSYKISEPDDIVNEMHSIFGTEIANLPQPLEDYYRQYFINRGTVVTFAQNYEREFSSKLLAISNIEARLAEQKAQIENEEKSLDNQLNQINADRSELDQLKNSGRYEEYNARVGRFNSEVNAYNRGVTSLKAVIENYNLLVNSQNDVIAQLRSLYGSLDTRLNAQTTR